MAFFLSPVLNEQQFDANGNPLNAGQIETYLAGTTTPVTTYKTSTGTAHSNPIILDSSGNYPTGTQLWLEGGKSYKFVVKTSVATGSVTLRTIDNITPINDTASSADEWSQYTATAFTYLSATSFSVVGDQTNIFQVNRRVKTQNTGGTIVGTVTNAVYSAPNTTVTVSNDSGSLDAGLSAVYYALLSASNPSVPAIYAKLASPVFTGDPQAPTPAAGDNDTSIATTAFVQANKNLRGFIDGLTLSTAGSSTTFSVSAGSAADSANAALLNLAASINKTTGAWAVGSGNGALDTGTIANSTWYYAYLIRRPDTGVVDVLVSTNSTTPTLPTNYTQYRYIGGMLTNGSAQWTKFYQAGDEFMWDAPIALDINTTTLSTTQTSFTVSVPRGRVMQWVGSFQWAQGAANAVIAVGSPLQTLPAPSLANGDLYAAVSGGTSAVLGRIPTNTSAQISAIANAASTIFRGRTMGWVDTRGRNA